MKKEYLILAFFFLIGSSCNGQFNEMNFLYKKSKEFYPTHLTDHIPELCNSQSFFITTIKGITADDTVMKGFDPHVFMLVNKYSDEDFGVEYGKISKLSLKEFSVNDTNQILIGSNLCLKEYDVVQIGGYNEGEESINIIKRNMRNENNIPLPIFNIEEFVDVTSTRLSKDFVLYVLDYHSGKVLKSGSFIEIDPEVVSRKWSNGYSRGYAISIKEKTIIYWVIAW